MLAPQTDGKYNFPELAVEVQYYEDNENQPNTFTTQIGIYKGNDKICRDEHYRHNAWKNNDAKKIAVGFFMHSIYIADHF